MPDARELMDRGIDPDYSFPGKRKPFIIYPTAENYESFRNFLVEQFGRDFEILARFRWELEDFQQHVTCEGIRLDIPEDAPGGPKLNYAAMVLAKLTFSQRP